MSLPGGAITCRPECPNLRLLPTLLTLNCLVIDLAWWAYPRMVIYPAFRGSAWERGAPRRDGPVEITSERAQREMRGALGGRYGTSRALTYVVILRRGCPW